MLQWKIGCSGFYYPEWKNIFYPKGLAQRKWFEYYCQHFSTVELNVTFYRFPRLMALQSWYDRSPSDFVFSVKAPRVITHFKKFKDSKTVLTEFYAVVHDGLREKAGCILFQFPASFQYDEEILRMMVQLMNKSFDNVLEFRHVSWWNEDVYKVLTENNIAFCGMSHPSLPDDVIQTTDVLYYRLHGVPVLYGSKYESYALQHLKDKISSLENVNRAYLYFNNTAAGHAITNAREILEFQPYAESK